MHILWLKTELLHPVDKGGKIRTYNILKELRRDHRITYLTLDDGSATSTDHESASEYCHELVCIPHQQHEKFTLGFYSDLMLNLASPLPYAIQKYESGDMRRKISERAGAGDFDIVVCDFLTPAVNVPFPQLPCPTVLFQHNVEAIIWKRHYEVQNNLLKRVYLLGQWRKMRRFEQEMCRRFVSVIAVSEGDREMIQKEYAAKAVFAVPTGVDTDLFRPSGGLRLQPNSLVFTGSMDWLPNEDAMCYFTEEIMPRVKQAVPEVTLTVVGRNPYPGLVALSKRDPSVIVTGRVDDVRPYMERAAAYVVPLRIGGGTRLKIFEAMAMEKPIVSTSIGAEGLPVQHGAELLVADTPELFAESVVRLLNDRALAVRLGQQAAKAVRERFGWDKVAMNFAEICELTLRQTQTSAASAVVTTARNEQPAV